MFYNPMFSTRKIGCENKERRLAMEVEYTARQVDIPKSLRTALRKQAEAGMQRIARILGKTATASVTFSKQKLLHIVEVTVKVRTQTFAAKGKADSLDAALRTAIEHVESQVGRYRDRRLESKRLPKEEKVATAPPVTPRSKTRAAQKDADEEDRKPTRIRAKTRVSKATHAFPTPPTVVEPNILNTAEAFSLKPMTIEEAVKETEFHDRDLLVFHNPAGDLFVLHRRRDGQMELVEIP
jgi:putative sigma-54 modulation protein